MAGNIEFNHEKCVGCGLCERDCFCKAISIENGKAVMNAESCGECGHCVAICPQNAVKMQGYDMSEVESLSGFNHLDAEGLLRSIRSRRSIRKFKNTPIEQEKIDRIIEAGRYTPTGSNRQKVRYIIVENPEENIEVEALKTINRIKPIIDFIGKWKKQAIDTSKFDMKKGFLFKSAPLAILVISDDPIDAGLASSNIATMAEALGLGVLYNGLFTTAVKANRNLKKQFSLKRKEKVYAAITLGYPNVKYQRTVPRKKAIVTKIS